MEKPWLSLMLISILCCLALCKGIESPEFAVIHAESDFEVRLYPESTWMTASARDISFEKSTWNGFHSIFRNFHIGSQSRNRKILRVGGRVDGPTLGNAREDFWDEFGAIRGLWSDPWCIGGDFNVVRFPGERSGASRLTLAMRRFTWVIDDLHLRNLPLLGGSFTWSGGLNNQAHLRPVSDHSPILLDVGGMRRGPSPFRFVSMWLKEEGFKELVKSWWLELSFRGFSSFILTEKLKKLKGFLKSWNFEVGFWDSQELLGTLSVEEEIARKASRVEFRKRALWRKQAGDRSIPGPSVRIRRLAPSISGMDFETLNRQDAAKLEEPFTEEERPLNDWKIIIVKRFLARLQDKLVGEGKEDKVCWVDMKSGTFSVKSLYASLETERVVQFPSSVVWNAWVPPKVCSFAWEATWGEALTLDQLQRRGLFQYIQGANLNFSRIAMTAPVLTSIVPGAGPLHSSAYFVRFYLPVKFQATPPLPLPELHLKPDKWAVHCIAVRKFSGYARDDNIVIEAEKLAISLSRSPWANFTTSESNYAYSIAQYSSPFQIFGRVNEIWVDVKNSGLEGCESSSVSTY
uniref:Uncharacterized protein n=2 Tax=Vitis vinifera TaxID=29760 RepID=A5AKX5_VITVI|nr:hypothetical protein VITISV_015519 [Vitis vinifera]